MLHYQQWVCTAQTYPKVKLCRTFPLVFYFLLHLFWKLQVSLHFIPTLHYLDGIVDSAGGRDNGSLTSPHPTENKENGGAREQENSCSSL
jgi:hypothetical protein